MNDKLLKSALAKTPINGEIMSLTKDVTKPLKAAPIMTPTAKSRAFPLRANSLNSFKNFFIVPRRGLEPPHLTAYAPQAYVYTSFTTWARWFIITRENKL